MTATSRVKLHSVRGFSLVSMMIAMVLSLVLIAGLFKIYLSNKTTYDIQSSLSRLQENARFAFGALTKQVREAGYYGCDRNTNDVQNVLNNSSSYDYNFNTPIQGFDAENGGWVPALPASITNVVPGTDVLTIRSLSGDPVFITQEMPDTSADLKTDPSLSASMLHVGDIVMLSDCAGSTIFQITNFNANDKGNVVHNTGTASPGNVTKIFSHRYTTNSEIQKMVTSTYFIRKSTLNTNRLALWRKNGSNPAQELVEGIDNMQILYGVDTDQNSSADVYKTADAVTNWDNVVSVKISLMVSGGKGTAQTVTPATLTMLGNSEPVLQDHRLRRIFTTTIALRNRLP